MTTRQPRGYRCEAMGYRPPTLPLKPSWTRVAAGLLILNCSNYTLPCEACSPSSCQSDTALGIPAVQMTCTHEWFQSRNQGQCQAGPPDEVSSAR